MRKTMRRAGFSLIEVTLALGVTAFCLLAIFGLFPIGSQLARDSSAHTETSEILSSVVADMRATPASGSSSSQYGIQFGNGTTIYFDDSGRFSSSLQSGSKYRADVTFPTSPTGLVYAAFALRWPAAAAPDSAATGRLEAFVAINRR